MFTDILLLLEEGACFTRAMFPPIYQFLVVIPIRMVTVF